MASVRGTGGSLVTHGKHLAHLRLIARQDRRRPDRQTASAPCLTRSPTKDPSPDQIVRGATSGNRIPDLRITNEGRAVQVGIWLPAPWGNCASSGLGFSGSCVIVVSRGSVRHRFLRFSGPPPGSLPGFR